MSSIKKSSRRSEDTMDDDSDDKDSKRKSRNLSEKKRRDQFNLLVNELSSMVATGSRKMDKSTVLKSTIAFLKNHNEIAVRSRVNEIQEDWKPTFLTNEEFTHLVLEAVDGFIMVFSASGQIFYASESITSLLGHLPNQVLNMTIYEMANEEEHSHLYNILLTPSEDQGQISFSCHLRRGDPDSKQNPSFELVHFVGYFRSDEDMVQSENRYSGYSGEADTRLVFVGTGKIKTPRLIREMPLVDSSKSEFTSRHSLEWKFLFLDHRAPPIIGYLPFELLGTSGYDYYHVDDLDNIIIGHKALMQKGEGTSCFYRFLTKGQQWIWLQTRYYITYHQWNSKPEFIVCTHRVVSYVDVMKQSRKEEGVTTSGTSPGNGGTTWPKNTKSNIRQGTASECTSMSADSPTSRQSVMTQFSVKSESNQPKPPPQMLQPQPQPQPLQPQNQIQPPHSQSLNHQFLEPPQYVAAIPMQPVISGFSPTGVISPIQPLDNVMLTPAQTQIQIDLQRKHAELQAIIGQQQAELRRVSEQLLMARLGLLPHNQPAQNYSPQVSITYQGSNSGTVSSTTTTIPGIQSSAVGSPSLIVPVSISLPIPQHQPNMLYTPSDSNGQTK
ncbi:circadian locomoter output cycles protein kaput [Tribolium madens]|uniref:circadian locomoter output cycles protein kaput n=1 Tax=Tribolium madens TaxID=41895 RepID=UPI001CF742D2|nr:circadian locomoter output cycles protein kaput [Tribolium madens]